MRFKNLVYAACLIFVSISFKTYAVLPTAVRVSYATVSNRQHFDLYVPTVTSSMPVLIMIHGGGWVWGPGASVKESVFKPNTSTSPMYHFIAKLMDQGVAVAIMKYRLPTYSKKALTVSMTGVRLSDMLDDINSAVAKVKEIAPQYHLDSGRIHLVGESAGAHLALMYAYQSTFSQQSSVKSVMSFYGPTDLSKEDTFLNFNTYTVGTNTPTPLSVVPGNLFQFSPSTTPDDDTNIFTNTAYPMRAFDSTVKLVGLNVEGSLQRKAYSPMNYVGNPSALPPTLILHGQSDILVNPNQAQSLASAIGAKDFTSASAVQSTSRHYYHLFAGFGHGWTKAGTDSVAAFDNEIWPVIKNWIVQKF